MLIEYTYIYIYVCITRSHVIFLTRTIYKIRFIHVKSSIIIQVILEHCASIDIIYMLTRINVR